METQPIHPHAPSLGKDTDGTIRVGGTRVTFDVVVGAYERGATPEGIVSQYDGLRLPQVYETINYYLNHREEADAYLKERTVQAKAIRRKLEEAGVTPNMAEVRERIERRMKQADARAGKR